MRTTSGAVPGHARALKVNVLKSSITIGFGVAVPGATALCVEPESACLDVGRRNLALNGRSATFVQAFVGSCSERSRVGRLECLDMDAVLARVDGRPIEVLHMDVQGAELPFIESMRRAVAERKVRFIVVSTHHEAVFSKYQKSVSGSATTHEECGRSLRSLGATVLVDHDVFESFSGDGLIVASFAAEDRSIVLPAISRNVRERSLFSGWISRTQTVAASAMPRQNGWLHRQVLKLRRSYRKRLRGRSTRRVA